MEKNNENKELARIEDVYSVDRKEKKFLIKNSTLIIIIISTIIMIIIISSNYAGKTKYIDTSKKEKVSRKIEKVKITPLTEEEKEYNDEIRPTTEKLMSIKKGMALEEVKNIINIEELPKVDTILDKYKVVDENIREFCNIYFRDGIYDSGNFWYTRDVYTDYVLSKYDYYGIKRGDTLENVMDRFGNDYEYLGENIIKYRNKVEHGHSDLYVYFDEYLEVRYTIFKEH